MKWLVCYDGSCGGKRAVEVTINMMKSEDKLIIVNIYEPFIALPNSLIDPEVIFPVDTAATAAENERRKVVGTKILSNAHNIAKHVIPEDHIDLVHIFYYIIILFLAISMCY